MKRCFIALAFALILVSCFDPKAALFKLMIDIDTYEAIYQSTDLTSDTIQMGFEFHKPLIDLETKKPLRVLTKDVSSDSNKYELRSIQFDESSWMEYVIFLKEKGKASSVKLSEHKGDIKAFVIDRDTLSVYKQTYNRNKIPRNNYSEFFTAQHGLVLISDRFSSRKLVQYRGKDTQEEVGALCDLIKADSVFYVTDTTSIFEVWEEVH